MSRAADAFGAFYRESRGRLMHQVYAYVGSTEVAQRTLADAYIAAAQHWRKVSKLDDRDAWMRDRAFSAARRSHNRARKPWFENAMRTADDNRPLLAAMSGLESRDRHLLIAHALAGKDLRAAAREVGLSDNAARLSLDTSLSALTSAGVDATSTDRAAVALERLRGDLHDEPIDGASRLRREGNRRRRSHVVLTGLSTIALVIGAGALTATHDEEDKARQQITQGGDGTDIEIADPEAPPTESFTTDSLATASTVSRLDPTQAWRVTSTSADFGRSTPIDECLQITPSEQRTAHYWVRDFSGGAGVDRTTVVQSLQIARSPKAAETAYQTTVMALSTCRGGEVARRLDQFDDIKGAGNAGSVVTYDYSMKNGIDRQYISVAQTGLATVVWIVHENPRAPVPPRRLIKITSESIDSLCVDAEGSCSTPPVLADEQTPPVPDNKAVGFLNDVDLPLFEGVIAPWVSTNPRVTRANPAGTQCDDADFSTARDALSRSFVIPGAKQLPTIFGMSETVASFKNPQAARRFASQVERRMSTCEDRDLNVTVRAMDDFVSAGSTGRIWEIEQASSENESFIYRMALVRSGDSIAQVTFTPAAEYDITKADYTQLAERAAARLKQLG